MRASGFDGHGLIAHIDDLGPEQLDRFEDVRAGVERRLDLDEHDLALNRTIVFEFDDLEHVDQLVQLLGDLLQRQAVDVDNDRHTRDLRHLSRADGQRFDVEAAS